MTDKQTIEQITSDNIRLRDRLNVVEPLLEKELGALNRQQTTIEGYQEVIMDDLFELLNKSMRISRINYLLGILTGISILNIAQTFLK